MSTPPGSAAVRGPRRCASRSSPIRRGGRRLPSLSASPRSRTRAMAPRSSTPTSRSSTTRTRASQRWSPTSSAPRRSPARVGSIVSTWCASPARRVADPGRERDYPDPRRRRGAPRCARRSRASRTGASRSRLHHDHVADAAPLDADDVYLRLHLLSHRKVRPHGCSLEGMFGLLNNVVWTDLGPFDPDGFEASPHRAPRQRRASSRCSASTSSRRWSTTSFPSGVRIAGARPCSARRPSRRRYDGDARGLRELQRRHPRAPRWSRAASRPGWWWRRHRRRRWRVDHGHALGRRQGGRLGRGGCLLGANAGIGISLGDNCVVEAGLYVTAGTLRDAARRHGGARPRAEGPRRHAVPPQLT